MIHSIISEEILYALGWTVIHSLWQAFLVGLVLALLLVSLQKHSAKFRYALANAAMLFVLGWSMFTFLDYYQTAQVEVIGDLTFWGAVGAAEGGSFLQNLYHSFSEYFNQHLPLIVTFWLLGVAFFMLRMLGSLAYVQHLKNKHTQPLSEVWQEKLEILAGRIPMKKTVGLMESAIVKVPMVVGFFKPVILMPMGAVNGLTVEQVEAILAHELAHIYRNDYILNIFQSLIETLFYFNPAVWWISANIRTERENCCDDIAVEVCGNSLAYAKALVSLQEMHRAAPALAMPLSGNKNQLLNRVRRILNQPQNKSNIMEKITATFMLFIAMLMLSFGANNPLSQFLEHEDVSDDSALHIIVQDHQDEGNNEFFFAPENDTIPKNKKGSTYIHKEKNDDDEVQLIIKDGKVKHLEINGEEIPEEKYPEYEDLVEELMEDIPEPPVPPTPPAPPAALFAPSAPAPSAPPSVKGVPTPPPAPPAPPAPLWRSSKKSRKITTEKDEEGHTLILIEDENGKDPIEIKINADEEGVIVIDGEEIKGLDDGDRVIIVEEYEDGSSSDYFVFDKDAPTIWSGKAFKNLEKLNKLKGFKYKDKDWKELKKDEQKDKDSNIWYFDNGNVKDLFEEYQGYAVIPEINSEVWEKLNLEPNVELAPNALLELKDNAYLLQPKVKELLEGKFPNYVFPDQSLLELKLPNVVVPDVQSAIEGYLAEVPDLDYTMPRFYGYQFHPKGLGEEDQAEWDAWHKRWNDELKERLKDGNVSKEWMEEWRKNLKEDWPEFEQYFPENNNLLFNNGKVWDYKGDAYKRYQDALKKYKKKSQPMSNPSIFEGKAKSTSFLFSTDINLSFGDGLLITNGAVWNDKISKKIKKELVQDKLISKGDSFELKLTSKMMKVNGVKQSTATFRKYLKLYKELSGRDFGPRTKIEFKT